MLRVIVDGPALAEFDKAKGKTEVFDKQGNLVGHFYPSSEFRIEPSTGEIIQILPDAKNPHENSDMDND